MQLPVQALRAQSPSSDGSPGCQSLAEDTKLSQNAPSPLRWPGDTFVPHKTAKWKEIRSYLFFPPEPWVSRAALLPQWLREIFLQKKILGTGGSWDCECWTVAFPWDKLNEHAGFPGVPPGDGWQTDTARLCKAVPSALWGLAWRRPVLCEVFQSLAFVALFWN